MGTTAGRITAAHRRLWLRFTEPGAAGPTYLATKLLQRKAEILFVQGEWPAAESLFRRALQAAELARADLESATIKCHLGLVLYNLGSYDAALQLEQEAYDFDVAGDDHAQALKPLTNIGNIQKGRGDLDQALESYQRALALSKECGDDASIGVCLGDIGLIHWYRGENERARECYDQKLAISEQLGDLYHIETTYANLGSVCFAMGDVAEAERYFHLQLDIACRIGDRASERVAYNNLCAIFEHRGEIGRMHEYYGRSLTIASEMGNKQGMRIVLGNLGSVHQQLGDFPRAEQHFRRSLSLARELGDKRGTGIALCSLGVLHRKLGDLPAARQELEESVGLLEPIRANDYLTEAQYQLALTLLAAGDRGGSSAVAERCLLAATAMGRGDHIFRCRLLQLGLGLDPGNAPQVAAQLHALTAPPERPDLEAERLFVLWRATGENSDRAAALAALLPLPGSRSDPEITGRIARLETA